MQQRINNEKFKLNWFNILMQFLVKSYKEDEYVRWLLDQTRIHILPSLNPDGFEVAREGTCSGGQGRSAEK